MLKLYNESGLDLPNLRRLAERSVVFDNHWVGSAPCMPARRDIMTGRLNFLERGWGPIEPFDDTLPMLLRDGGISTHMFTDHYHYFEIGGENYCQQFNQWEFVRGQEWDPEVLSGDPMPEHIGKMHPQYARNREQFYRTEERYPSVVTVEKAAKWLEENHARDDFFLWVEPFDPHEPFEVPQKYLDMVGDDYTGPLYQWPEYDKTDGDEEHLKHIRRRYAALLLMTDKHLGSILDVMDRHGMWDDTAFIYTTDHGYMLGEHDFMAKNYMPCYEELVNIPFFLHDPRHPEADGTRRNALTQTIDIPVTLLRYFGKPVPDAMQGRDLEKVITDDAMIHDAILFGYFGKHINVRDQRYVYMRAARDNTKLNEYTLMATRLAQWFTRDELRMAEPEMYRGFDYCGNVPVMKIPGNTKYVPNVTYLDYDVHLQYGDLLFDLEKDKAEEHNLKDDEKLVRELSEKMIRLMKESEAPAEQYERMGF